MRIYFFSLFNDKDFASFIGTFFGMGEDSSTVISIELAEVDFIYKCTNAFIFDNSIGIRMRSTTERRAREAAGEAERADKEN